jgi:hypothetical protein
MSCARAGEDTAMTDEKLPLLPPPDFGNPKLVERYGSWVRVQVAFYDFIFEEGMGMCAACANPILIEDAQREVAEEGWHDDGPVFRMVVSEIEKSFKSPEEAWKRFVEQEQD